MDATLCCEGIKLQVEKYMDKTKREGGPKLMGSVPRLQSVKNHWDKIIKKRRKWNCKKDIVE